MADAPQPPQVICPARDAVCITDLPGTISIAGCASSGASSGWQLFHQGPPGLQRLPGRHPASRPREWPDMVAIIMTWRPSLARPRLGAGHRLPVKLTPGVYDISSSLAGCAQFMLADLNQII